MGPQCRQKCCSEAHLHLRADSCLHPLATHLKQGATPEPAHQHPGQETATDPGDRLPADLVQGSLHGHEVLHPSSEPSPRGANLRYEPVGLLRHVNISESIARVRGKDSEPAPWSRRQARNQAPRLVSAKPAATTAAAPAGGMTRTKDK